MIRIFKNSDVQLVTKGAFESIFKPLGYKQVIEVKEEKPVLKNEVRVNTKKNESSKEKKNEKEV